MVQKRAFAHGADSGNLIQRRAADGARPPHAVRADREPVRLVAQPLQEIEHRISRRQHERPPRSHVEPLPAGVALGSLGHGDQRDIVDAEVGEHLARRRQVPRAAVDQHELRPGAAVTVRVLLQGAPEAAAEHLAQHREIVTGGDIGALDVELAVGVLHQPLGAGDDHGADGVGTGDVAVVVHLDPSRRAVEAEGLRHPFEQPALGGAFRKATRQRLARVRQRVVDELALGAAGGPGEVDPAAGAHRERLDQYRAFRRQVAHQHRGRRDLVGVELAEEGLHHLDRAEFRRMGREVGAVAEVLAGAEEEHLDAGLVRLLVCRDDVGIAEIGDVDVLMGLDLGQRMDAVAEGGGGFELQRIAGVLHARGQALLQVAALAIQEVPRLLHDGGVVVPGDAADTGRGAALDLVLQAGAGAAREDGVRA